MRLARDAGTMKAGVTGSLSIESPERRNNDERPLSIAPIARHLAGRASDVRSTPLFLPQSDDWINRSRSPGGEIPGGPTNRDQSKNGRT